jgi:hypothetical protein
MLAKTKYAYLNLHSIASLVSIMQRLELEVLQIAVQKTTRPERAVKIRWAAQQSTGGASM